jgi:hypothetical protein
MWSEEKKIVNLDFPSNRWQMIVPSQISVAYDTEDLPRCIRQLNTFVPKERKANPDAVIDRIRNFLNNLQTPTESLK